MGKSKFASSAYHFPTLNQACMNPISIRIRVEFEFKITQTLYISQMYWKFIYHKIISSELISYDILQLYYRNETHSNSPFRLYFPECYDSCYVDSLTEIYKNSVLESLDDMYQVILIFCFLQMNYRQNFIILKICKNVIMIRADDICSLVGVTVWNQVTSCEKLNNQEFVYKTFSTVNRIWWRAIRPRKPQNLLDLRLLLWV